MYILYVPSNVSVLLRGRGWLNSVMYSCMFDLCLLGVSRIIKYF